jgi:hypothetical protein
LAKDLDKFLLMLTVFSLMKKSKQRREEDKRKRKRKTKNLHIKSIIGIKQAPTLIQQRNLVLYKITH